MISLNELAHRLGLHPNTIRNYVIKDGMPCIKTKGKYLFDYEKVIEWLENK